ncbi:MAG: DNA-processing protein DprA [Patescibacteria group bacterium]
MDHFPIYPIDIANDFPQLLEIPHPPRLLHMRGNIERIAGTILITFVGSRNHTHYGKEACESLIQGLKDYRVTIVSGLALGIDSVAHEAALAVGLPTLALPGSGLDEAALYPRRHAGLAVRILENGGALLSEFDAGQRGMPWTFPQRNRLLAGISVMTIIIEAEERSGTLITARLATDYNRTVGSVPGPINSATSFGTNELLKLGAVPITSAQDIVQELNLELKEKDILYIE